jgi:hypothetical protein
MSTSFRDKYHLPTSSQALRHSNKETQNWLQKRNKKVSQKLNDRNRHAMVHEHLINGIISKDAEREVLDNVMFMSPLNVEKSKARGSNYKELFKTKKFTAAIDKLKKYDEEDRWSRGVNATTLMTEYRRKLIFHALLASNDVDEERKEAQEKLKLFMEVNAPHLLSDVQLDELQNASLKDDASSTNQSSTYGQERRQSTTKKKKDKLADPRLSILRKPKSGHFSPNYDDYDVMHNRWYYLYPQLTAMKDAELRVPVTTNRALPSDVTKANIKGSLREILHFETHSKDAFQKRNVSTSTHGSK